MQKLANINFTEQEFNKVKSDYFNNNKKYLIKYNTIYLINYSENTGFGARKVYENYDRTPIVQRGRFIIVTAKLCNEIIERKLFLED